MTRNVCCLVACLVALVASSSAGDAQTTVAQAPVSRSAESLTAVIKNRVPKDIPMLDDLVVVKPDPSVPAELAHLSGAWVGEWHGERTNAHMADDVEVFEKVSATSVTVASMGIGRFIGKKGGNKGQTWSSRSDRSFEKDGGAITIISTRGNRITYEVKNGQLIGRMVLAGNRGVWIGTFERVTR